MSTDNLFKFFDAVSARPELQAKLQAIHADTARRAAEEIAALATEIGIPLTAEEVLAGSAADGELSEEMLDNVAGGYLPSMGFTSATLPQMCRERL
jgi:predicted ribosomally synthesized peptide with nif11-like leader